MKHSFEKEPCDRFAILESQMKAVVKERGRPKSPSVDRILIELF